MCKPASFSLIIYHVTVRIYTPQLTPFTVTTQHELINAHFHIICFLQEADTKKKLKSNNRNRKKTEKCNSERNKRINTLSYTSSPRFTWELKTVFFTSVWCRFQASNSLSSSTLATQPRNTFLSWHSAAHQISIALVQSTHCVFGWFVSIVEKNSIHGAGHCTVPYAVLSICFLYTYSRLY